MDKYEEKVTEIALSCLEEYRKQDKSFLASVESSEICSRVLALESLILTSDLFYKCSVFKVFCNSNRDIELLKTLVSLGTSLSCYIGDDYGAVYCNIMLQNTDIARVFRQEVFSKLANLSENILKDETSGNYYYKMLDLVRESYFNDLCMTHRDLDAYIRNRTICSDLLNLGVLDVNN